VAVRVAFRAAVRFAGARLVAFFAVVERPVDVAGAAFLAVVRRAGARFAVDLPAGAFFAVDLRAGAFFAVDLRAGAFFAVDPRVEAAVRFAGARLVLFLAAAFAALRLAGARLAATRLVAPVRAVLFLAAARLAAVPVVALFATAMMPLLTGTWGGTDHVAPAPAHVITLHRKSLMRYCFGEKRPGDPP
jgi:hypothetical protein